MEKKTSLSNNPSKIVTENMNKEDILLQLKIISKITKENNIR